MCKKSKIETRVQLKFLPSAENSFDLARHGCHRRALCLRICKVVHLAIDHATYFLWVFLQKRETVDSYIFFLKKIFACRIPKKFLDCGPDFTGKKFKRFPRTITFISTSPPLNAHSAMKSNQALVTILVRKINQRLQLP